MTFLPFILLFVVFYFLLIRPQQKKAKQHKTFHGEPEKGRYCCDFGWLVW